MRIKLWLLVLMTALFLSALAGLALAAEYPAKPIDMYIVFAPGGSMDSSSRALAAAAEEILGQPIVPVNKAGGGGTVGLGLIAKAKPDGYTICGFSTTGIIRVPQLRKLNYKPLEDFTFIFGYSEVATGLVVRPDSQFKNFQELLHYARQNPGKIKYSSAGVNTVMHLIMELIAKRENIKWTHVPYTGSNEAETALLGGHVDVCSTGDMNKTLGKQLRPLVVYTQKRIKQLPDAPTLIEEGIDYYNDSIFGIVGPKGMDPVVVKKLQDAFAQAVQSPKYQKVSDDFCLISVSYSHEEFTSLIEKSWDTETKVLKDLNLIETPATDPR